MPRDVGRTALRVGKLVRSVDIQVQSGVLAFQLYIDCKQTGCTQAVSTHGHTAGMQHVQAMQLAWARSSALWDLLTRLCNSATSSACRDSDRLDKET